MSIGVFDLETLLLRSLNRPIAVDTGIRLCRRDFKPPDDIPVAISGPPVRLLIIGVGRSLLGNAHLDVPALHQQQVPHAPSICASKALYVRYRTDCGWFSDYSAFKLLAQPKSCLEVGFLDEIYLFSSPL